MSFFNCFQTKQLYGFRNLTELHQNQKKRTLSVKTSLTWTTVLSKQCVKHRCALRSSNSSYSGPVQGRRTGRAIAAIDKVAIIVGWRWKKETQATKLRNPHPASYSHPLTSMPAPKQGLQRTPHWQQHLQSSPSGSTCSSTLFATSIAPNCARHSVSKQHPAPAPCSGIPTAPRCLLQSAHTTLTAARTASTAC